MSERKMTLLVGGPADGTWRVLDGPAYIVVEPGKIDWKSESVALPDLKEVRYDADVIVVFGFKLDIAVAGREFRSSAERNKAIIRALFQRDVAEAMGAGL